MREKEILKLREGEKIFHKQLGVCTVNEVVLGLPAKLFGLSIVPDTIDGRRLLTQWADTPPGKPLLETTYRYILNKVVS